MNITPLEVTPTLILYVDLAMEIARAVHMAELLKRYAKPMQASEFNDKYPRLDPYDRCYDNAVQVSKSHGLIYCEGIMILQTKKQGPMPLAHGWCMTHEGEIVDPTCHKYQHISEVSYLGIPFKADYVDWWHGEVGYHGILDGHVDRKPVGVYHDPSEKWLQLIA